VNLWSTLIRSARRTEGHLAYLSKEDGTLENVSLELLHKGREMADQMHWQLSGLLLGSGVAKFQR
jgi:hypothetical protein